MVETSFTEGNDSLKMPISTHNNNLKPHTVVLPKDRVRQLEELPMAKQELFEQNNAVFHVPLCA